jgi:hypothetical protein
MRLYISDLLRSHHVQEVSEQSGVQPLTWINEPGHEAFLMTMGKNL